jgi:hypothetical protein
MAAPSASEYLATKTASLEAESPVPPSQARAAQIPLKDFNLPTFPAEAFTAGLTNLILTSDIKLDEYTTTLSQPFSVPSLPPSITSLTLELFSLGYPPGFLTTLGKALPKLKALTLYSQLFAGTTPDSQDDAVAFVLGAKALKEVHILDVFAPPGIFTSLANAFAPSLRFLEISYTFRHSDPGFLDSLPAKELVGVVRGDLVALTMGISAPDVSPQDEEDREGTEVGVKPVGGKDAKGVLEKLVSEGKGLVMLDATMFELSVKDLKALLGACGKLKVLNVAVVLESGWDEVLKVLGEKLRGVEALEIVGIPGEEFVEKLKGSGVVQLTKEALARLSENSKSLKSVKTSILRTNAEQWVQHEGSWEKIN